MPPRVAGSPPPAERPAYATVRLAGVPHIQQKPDFCGEACAAMVLAKLGYRINQDDVFDQAGIDPELGRGSYTKELSRALTRIGFRVGTVWFQVAAAQAEAELESHFRALHADLSAGVPSIVCMRYDDTPEASEHFRLVLGYDYEKDEVLYHEPAVADGAYARMTRLQFLKLWPLKYEAERWTVIRLRLVPGSIRDVHSTAKFTDADYAQRVIAVKRKTPEGFSIVVQRPFVVVGDEPAAEVRRHAIGYGAMGSRSSEAGVLRGGPECDPRHLAVQGRGQLQQAHAGDLRRHTGHAVRLLLAHAQSPDHEHRHGHGDPGA